MLTGPKFASDLLTLIFIKVINLLNSTYFQRFIKFDFSWGGGPCLTIVKPLTGGVS